MSYTILSNEDISGLEELTGATMGMIRPIPSAEVEKFTFSALRLFLHKYGLYTMPTTELIDYLAGIIKDKSAVEIGAGLGVIGRSLGIPITDNKMQEWPEIKARYDLMRQPTIKYPPDIIEMDALKAISHYKPEIVIGSYITHLWRPGMESGNQHGVDTLKLIKSVPEYLMIGSFQTHRNDPAMPYLDKIEQHDFLYTRAGKEASVIFRWKK